MDEGSPEPVTAVDRAGNAALRAMERSLIAEGARLKQAFVVIVGEGQPNGEPNSTLAGYGYEGGRDLLSELLAHAAEIGERIGVRVNVIPLESEAGHG